MKKLIPVELLEKYINGECTEDEVAIVKKWYRSFENDHDYVSDISFDEEKELDGIYSIIVNRIDDAHEKKIVTERSAYSVLKKWYTLVGGLRANNKLMKN